MTRLETDRLILRPLRDSDAPSVAELIGNWQVAKMLTRVPYPYALQDAEDFIARFADGPTDSDTQVFALELKQGPTHAVGCIGIHGEAEAAHEAELGYWIGEPYWRQGLVFEAARAAVAHAFTSMGLTKLYAGHFTENEGSKKILMKCGFTDFGVKTMESVSRGCDTQCRQLALTRETWEQVQ